MRDRLACALLLTTLLACGTTVVVIEGNEGDEGKGGTGAVGTSIVSAGGGASGPVTTSGIGGAVTVTSSVITSGAGGSCASQVFPVEAAPEPVDLVVAYGGFQSPDALTALGQMLHPTVVTSLENQGHSVRTIAIGEHGSSSSSGEICFQPPLAAPNNCVGAPGIVPNTFYHYSLPFLSGSNVLCALLDGIDGTQPDEFGLAPLGFSTWFRLEALKAVVVVADTNVSCSPATPPFLHDQGTEPGGKSVATEFDSRWLASAPGHLGSPAHRRYQVHALTRTTGPANGFTWSPSDPFQLGGCGGFAQPGTGYQALAVGTEGRRGTLCPGASYANQLSEIAVAISQRARDRCRFAIPAGAGSEFIVTFDAPNEPIVTWDPVASANDCGAPGGYYLDDATVVLCPESCDVVEDAPAGVVEVATLCAL